MPGYVSNDVNGEGRGFPDIETTTAQDLLPGYVSNDDNGEGRGFSDIETTAAQGKLPGYGSKDDNGQGREDRSFSHAATASDNNKHTKEVVPISECPENYTECIFVCPGHSLTVFGACVNECSLRCTV